ncbi:MAG TPA: hypothetical protein VFB22_11280 [Candidatus Baltobacteraceae bacterium]|nr:hypothetical protein [Candidatus Baltobacteraceae bacterium]
MKVRGVVFAAALVVAPLAGCGGSGAVLPPLPANRSAVIDTAAQACVVTVDGFIAYALPAGSFGPIDTNGRAACGGTLAATPPIPAWAHPAGPTKTVFVATSLQEAYSVDGMQSIESTASAHRLPVTWMIGNGAYLANAGLYQSFHAANGDTVQAEPDDSLIAAMQAAFPWYAQTVSVDGAGHERDVAADLARGDTGFWGITWNSHGTDGTYDLGAPWGTYCADPSSYKRPQPDGGCTLLAFEWTARDLTRAYLSDTAREPYGAEAAFSTDPDDLLQRAGFDVAGAQSYVAALADAYAAAGETQTIVMMSQQESANDTASGDPQVLDALYARAVADGMTVETLPQADAAVRAASAAPRAVAFPYIAGGPTFPSIVDGGTVYPATIDFHDTKIGATFLAGHTLPTRAFRYADDPLSSYAAPLAPLPPQQYPTLQSAAVHGGSLLLTLQAPAALHFALALWTNPAQSGIAGTNVTPAGRAGAVIVVDLLPGVNQVVVPCARCTSTTFPYST